MATKEDELAQSLQNRSSDASPLAAALRPGKVQILGSYVTGSAVRELLRQVPDISSMELRLIRNICDSNSQAAEDMTLLEERLRDGHTVGSDDADEIDYTNTLISQSSGSLFTDIVKVSVGKIGEIFEVHRKYLIRIPYFSRLLGGAFSERGSLQASLPEDSPAAFERVLQYIYTGQPVTTLSTLRRNDYDESTHAKALKETLLMMETYLLADKLCLEGLANQSIDLLRKSYVHWQVDCEELRLAIDNGSGTLKRLTLRMLVFGIIKNGWASFMQANDNIYQRFVLADVRYGEAVAKAIADFHHLGNPGKDIDACSWHVHGTTSKCAEAQGTKRKRDGADDG